LGGSGAKGVGFTSLVVFEEELFSSIFLGTLTSLVNLGAASCLQSEVTTETTGLG
jgi:hypothetical protein